MEVTTIKTPKIELTDDLASYLQERLDSCDKFVPDDVAVICEVELARTTEHHKQGNIYYAEVNLEVDGTPYRATATAESLHEAIDEVKDDLQRELRRDKDKQHTLLRKGGLAVKNMMRGFGEKFNRSTRE